MMVRAFSAVEHPVDVPSHEWAEPCLRWRGAPRQYGPAKTLYHRWKRWRDMGVFARIMTGLVAAAPDHTTVSIDATDLKAHRTASSLRSKKGGRGRLIGRTKGDMNAR